MNRKIDDLNRIVIPKEITNRLGVFPGDVLDIQVDGDDNIILSKQERNKCTTEIVDKIVEAENTMPLESEYRKGIVDALKWVLNINN